MIYNFLKIGINDNIFKEYKNFICIFEVFFGYLDGMC